MNCSVSVSSEDVMSLEEETGRRREMKRGSRGSFWEKGRTVHSVLTVPWNPFRVSSSSSNRGENRLVLLQRPKFVIVCTTSRVTASWSDRIFDLITDGVVIKDLILLWLLCCFRSRAHLLYKSLVKVRKNTLRFKISFMFPCDPSEHHSYRSFAKMWEQLSGFSLNLFFFFLT